MVVDFLIELMAEIVEKRRKKRMTATGSAHNSEASAGKQRGMASSCLRCKQVGSCASAHWRAMQWVAVLGGKQLGGELLGCSYS
jgi:hypothetical protein